MPSIPTICFIFFSENLGQGEKSNVLTVMRGRFLPDKYLSKENALFNFKTLKS